MARQQHWKLLLPILVFLTVLGGFWSPQSVAAADGNEISNLASGDDKTTAIATGVSFDNLKVCAVWSRFDVDPQAFVRVLDVPSGTWSPTLNANPTQLSSGGFSGVESTRCAFDTAGTLHAVWQQKESGQPFKIMHRSLPNGGSWSGITEIDGNGDGPDIAADDDGRVWLVHRKYQGSSGSQLYVRSRQGVSWSAPQIFTASGEAGNPRIGVDNAGYVHLAWKNGGSGRGYAFYNSNNGQFSAEVTVPNSNSSGNFSLAVNRDNGDVHIVYSKNFSEIYYARKTGLGTTSFGGATKIADAAERSLGPQIAWSPNRLIMVFDSGNKDRLEYITSVNQGANWSGVTTLADPGGGAESPWVVADQDGKAYVAYAHRSGSSVFFTTIAGFIPVAERCAGFADVRNTDPACAAIANLTQRGVIAGYATNPPTFGPTDAVQRAQMAAFLVRDLGWGTRPQGPNTFNDFGQLVGELKAASLILANACADPRLVDTCVAKGYGNGRFAPNDQVTYAQVISFITRAYVLAGRWTPQAAAHPYGGVPTVHESDVRTFYAYTDGLGGVPNRGAINWNQAAPRAWVAQALFQAAQSPPTP